MESWPPYRNANAQIDGYCSLYRCRKEIFPNSRLNSGGVTVLVKSSHRKGVKFVDKESNEAFVWWKLEKTFFNLISDIFVCTVYIPPQNSSQEIRLNTDRFENLQKYNKFLVLGDIILCGDFNARTGNLDDFSRVDSFLTEGNVSKITISKRFSRNININHYGRFLVKLCIENDLVTLNGRTKGFLIRQFTCNTYNGSGVVDYTVVSHDLFQTYQGVFQ